MSNEELLRKSVLEGVLERRESQKMRLQDWGSVNDNFGGYCEDIGWKALRGWCPGSGEYPVIARWAAIREVVDNFINDPLLKGFGPTLMAEKIEQMKGIRLSKETLRKMMIEAGVWKAKVKKKAEPHYARPRRKHRGELVQIDGSEHAWLEDRGPKATLLVFVDDATSQILAAEFVPEESFFSYGNLCQRYFREHGLPKAFTVTALASFGSIAEKSSGMNRLLSSNGRSASWIPN